MRFPVVATEPGVTRQVLAETPELMLVAFRFTAGASGRPHSHPHVQASYVQSGRFRFDLGGQSHELAPGDSLLVPSGAVHGCQCLETGMLIDSFTPRRDDFL